MGVTTYYSAGGELLGHRTDVGTDALGSVTVTAIDDQQRTPTNCFYEPYGSRLNKLGNNADPWYLWNSTSGYRETAISHSKSYVRARHYGQEEGSWTTVDKLWPNQPVYQYARNSPTVFSDRSGMVPTFGSTCSVIPPGEQDKAIICLGLMCDALRDPVKGKKIEACFRDQGYLLPTTLQCLDEWCKKGQPFWCPQCMPEYKYTCVKVNPCGGIERKIINVPECPSSNCKSDYDPGGRITICDFLYKTLPTVCPGANLADICGSTKVGPGSLAIVIMHELTHMCGKCKQGGKDHRESYNLVAQCISKMVDCK